MDARLKKLIVCCVFLTAAVGGWFYFNRGYGEVSEVSYQFATALYAACNQRDADKLSRLSEMIAASQAQEEIDAREARWLNGIIDLGRHGDWEKAANETRKLLADQVQGV